MTSVLPAIVTTAKSVKTSARTTVVGVSINGLDWKVCRGCDGKNTISVTEWTWTATTTDVGVEYSWPSPRHAALATLTGVSPASLPVAIVTTTATDWLIAPSSWYEGLLKRGTGSGKLRTSIKILALVTPYDAIFHRLVFRCMCPQLLGCRCSLNNHSL